MKYFLPDSQDFVDPSFDFEREVRSKDRVRQRDDRYVHEVFAQQPIDGVLLSKGVVEPVPGKPSGFSQAQRLRLLREGVREFYRLPKNLPTMGDCGAFTYVKLEKPPFSVDETIDFYERCKFDYGIAVDHIVLGYNPEWDADLFGDCVPAEARDRRALTIRLAREFLRKSEGQRFRPVGVAHGWSPASYASSVRDLQKMGYHYIAIGGVAMLKTAAVIEVLRAISKVRKSSTKLHLLGVARIEHLDAFAEHGVASFDSTSPLRKAWMDERSNYHTASRTFMALRVPQVGANPRLRARIASGDVDQDEAIAAEHECLEQLSRFGRGRGSVGSALRALVNYEAIHSPKKSRSVAYRETLEAAPWRSCPCDVCRRLGHHVIMFRGAERNRRRGFHNVWNFYRRMHGAHPKNRAA